MNFNKLRVSNELGNFLKKFKQKFRWADTIKRSARRKLGTTLDTVRTLNGFYLKA